MKEKNKGLHLFFLNNEIPLYDLISYFNFLPFNGDQKIQTKIKNIKITKGRYLCYDGNQKEVLLESKNKYYVLGYSGS